MRPAYSGLKRRGPTVSPLVVLGRKFCVRCGRWRHVSDFKMLTQGRGLHCYCRACHRAYERERNAQRTPEEREKDREYQAIWWDARARRLGIPRREFKNRQADGDGQVYLPIQPLLEQMNKWLMLHVPEWRRDEDRTVEKLADLAGTSARQIYRFQVGESRRVQLDLADRIAMAMDIPLVLLYDDEEMAA